MDGTNTGFYDLQVTKINGQATSLAEYKGKSLLIVNVASECGFTPQYEGLEKLYKSYKDQGLVVMGFPCNQFGKQEPGNDQQIATFCTTRFNVTFPMFAKVDVNGSETHPLFDFLKSSLPGLLNTEAIKWNFTKFFVDKNGKPLKRFSPQDTPDKMESWIKEHL